MAVDVRRTTLGRTGLTVSRVGLGCGGSSRLGQGYGASPADAEREDPALAELTGAGLDDEHSVEVMPHRNQER